MNTESKNLMLSFDFNTAGSVRSFKHYLTRNCMIPLQYDHIVINDIQINEGPLGSREMTIKYGDDLKEYVVLELIAGSPVTMNVLGWNNSGKVRGRMEELVLIKLRLLFSC